MAAVLLVDQHRIFSKPTQTRSKGKIAFKDWLNIQGKKTFCLRVKLLHLLHDTLKFSLECKMIIFSLKTKGIGSYIMLIIFLHPFLGFLITKKENQGRLKVGINFS